MSRPATVRRRAAVLLSALALASCGLVEAPADTREATARGDIVGRANVTDGDTFEIRGQRIRLWGVDAPESSQPCFDRDGRPWRCGTAAANALADWLGARTVHCERKGRSYERIVGRCRAGGRDVGEWLVTSGWALDYARHSKRQYADAEQAARQARAGIHAGTFEAPWDYRRQRRGGSR